MLDLLARLAPYQSGALWIGFLVAFLVFGDHERLAGRRNLALLGLLSVAVPLFDILDMGRGHQAWALRAIFVLTGCMALGGLALSRGGLASWRPNLPIRALQVVVSASVVAATATVITRPADDAGTYTNLGAQRWMETGRLPYGDQKLKGPDSPAFGAAATYGPVLYALHLPFQVVLGTRGNDPQADPRTPSYQWPTGWATKLASLTMFLVGLTTFFVILRRLAGVHAAWGGLAVMASLPYFIGLGGADYVIGGLRFVSHIAPMAVTLLAFAFLDRPVWAGVLLATAAGVLFYPAFMFPVWLAWYLFRGQGGLRFAAGFAAAGAVIAAVVITMTDTGPGDSAVGLFFESTLEHQEGTGPREYGGSEFSFWTHQPGLSAAFQTPLVGGSSLFKLSFLLYAGFVGLLSLASRGRTVAQLAALTGAAAAAVQLWKTHATGSYVEWYLPFLMIALFAQARSDDSPKDQAAQPEPADVGEAA